MISQRWMTSGSGFSLIELIVSVALIGILVAIGGPQYQDLIRRARHSEARINLSNLYTSEMTFPAEHLAFTSRFDSLGYEVVGNAYGAVNANTFVGVAHTHLSANSPDWFTWTIDQNKNILQRSPAN